MNIEGFFEWVKENPSEAAEDLIDMCSEHFNFEFAKKCTECNYFVNGDCCPERLAEEIENL